MPQLAQTGQFCPNPHCDHFNNTQDHAIIKHAKTKQGKQRYRCKACGKTFSQNKDTLFYGKRKPPEMIIETLLLIAKGTGIRPTARIKKLHPQTVINWLKAAAVHAQELEHLLLEDYRVDRAQIDGLWSYVGKKDRRRLRDRIKNGARPLLADYGDRVHAYAWLGDWARAKPRPAKRPFCSSNSEGTRRLPRR